MKVEISRWGGRLFIAELNRPSRFSSRKVTAGRIHITACRRIRSRQIHRMQWRRSLSRMCDAARVAAASQGTDRHHFAVLQCPMNLYEAGALVTAQYRGGTAGDGVGGSRNEKRSRCCQSSAQCHADKNRAACFDWWDFPFEGNPVDFDQQCRMVAALEEEYRKAIAPTLQLSGQGMAPADFFTWAVELTRVRPQIQGLEHWEQIEQQMIALTSISDAGAFHGI